MRSTVRFSWGGTDERSLMPSLIDSSPPHKMEGDGEAAGWGFLRATDDFGSHPLQTEPW
jgi:hypothetical protein